MIGFSLWFCVLSCVFCGFVFLCLVDWVKVWVMSFVVVFIYIGIVMVVTRNKLEVG